MKNNDSESNDATKESRKANQNHSILQNVIVTPEYLTPMEMAALAKISESGIKGGIKLASLWSSEDPLFIQIIDSIDEGDLYRVSIKATNMTVHGIYLDMFTLTSPNGEAQIESRGEFHFGSSAKTDRRQPVPKPLPSKESAVFNIKFKNPGLFDTGALKEKFGGSGIIKYWVLNEHEPKTKKVEFSLRTKQNLERVMNAK